MTIEQLTAYFHRPLPPTYEQWASPTTWPATLELHPAIQIVDLSKYIDTNLERMMCSESRRIQQLAQEALTQLHLILVPCPS